MKDCLSATLIATKYINSSTYLSEGNGIKYMQNVCVPVCISVLFHHFFVCSDACVFGLDWSALMHYLQLQRFRNITLLRFCHNFKSKNKI